MGALFGLIILFLIIKVTISFGTIPFVCDVNSNFTDVKIPSLSECNKNNTKYTTINASIWKENYVELDSMLYRSIERICLTDYSNDFKFNILHTNNKIKGYKNEKTFEYPTNPTYNMLNGLNYNNRHSNRWLYNECYDKEYSTDTGRYAEIKKFKHRFYSDRSIILINDKSDDLIANKIIEKCFSNAVDTNINKGKCKYTDVVNNLHIQYMYLWNIQNISFELYKIFDSSVLPNIVNYKNGIFPYKLIEKTVTIKLVKNIIEIPSMNIGFDNIIVNTNDNIMTCLSDCKYYITYPITDSIICENKYFIGTINNYNYDYRCGITNLTKIREIWLKVFINKRKLVIDDDKDEFTIKYKNITNLIELESDKKELYKNLFGSENVYINIFDDNILPNSVYSGEINYYNLKIKNLIDNTYIICKNIKMYNKIIDALCNTNPYRCLVALFGINNIKVFKEYDIYKVKQCNIIEDYKFKFNEKNSYNNNSCYSDIPIMYKINNNIYNGFFNIQTGEILSESHITNYCPDKYNIELNNILYDVYNNTMRRSGKKIETVLNNKKIELQMPIYNDIIPQIEKIKNLPNLQDIKSFESTDEIYSDIISKNEIIHEYIPPTPKSILDYLSNILDSPLKILILVVIIIIIVFSIIALCVGCVWIKTMI
ncbi:putative glycoprotein B [Betaentomopoxvirus amoorei]|uniref:AMV045 n=1 Tax=Amsacta moorei entomopoxvirus TaxID=28321 RepID=Q9EN03_AMEPV|nr:putative glycoprotein B [Amsacta moorei entomopoxvirus]AAG02751.1 AMV045 [Amsacta moorei entomopoxvirus]